MTTPTTTLRPLGMGELIDRAVRLYRRNFSRFIGVIAVMLIPVSGLQLIVNLATYQSSLESIPSPSEIENADNPFSLLGPEYYVSALTGILVSIGYLVLVNGVASAALTRLVSDAYLGETADAFGAYRAIGDRWQTLIRAIIVFLVVFFLALVWFIVPCVGWLTGPGLLVVLAGMVLPLLAPVVVMENFGARGSFRRAWELVRGRFWWIFGFMVLLSIFGVIVVSGPSTLASVAFGFLIPDSLSTSNPQLFDSLQLVISSLIQMMFSLVYLPLQLTCVTLLYFDLRVRQEGLDLVLAAGNPGEGEITMRELIAQSTTMPNTPTVTGREMVNFAGLTILVVIVYLVFVVGLAGVILAASGSL